MTRTPHVAILGGGVAGMSAAHELMERGFRVSVVERQAIPGGKARSIRIPNSNTAGRRPLPTEHGFRFFPGWYRHLPDTMRRIPYAGKRNGVFDNLVEASRTEIILAGARGVVVPARFPRSFDDLGTLLEGVMRFDDETEISLEDLEFYQERVWQLLTSCRERRRDEYERTPWWVFIDAEGHGRSPRYGALLARGMTRALVAADPKIGSTKTLGDVLLQMLFNLTEPGVAADRVLDGPTNDVWIDPWLLYLRSNGVRYDLETTVTAISCAQGEITGVRVRDRDGGERTVTADYYIAALPVEALDVLITPELIAAERRLANLHTLSHSTAWMNGIQFFLSRDVTLTHGHQLYLDSPWALTSVSHPQFWPDVDLGGHGDGSVRGILAVIVSDWDQVSGPPLRKAAKDCTREEIADEVWRQLKQSLNHPGQEVLRDEDLRFWSLDDDITVATATRDARNAEPLLVNRAGSWELRPEAQTRIPNFFLASDYVRTNTDLATMEAANEAARRAVNGVLAATRYRGSRCTVWKPYEPPLLSAWRWADRLRYWQGKPWRGRFPLPLRIAQQMLLATEPLFFPTRRAGAWAKRGWKRRRTGRVARKSA